MRAKVWGCRGSLATPGAETVRYGGNTSCVEVVLDSGDRIVLDAGTGLRPLGVELGRDGGEIKERPVTPGDLAATIYRHMGVPLDTTYVDHQGRPRRIVESGEPIRELC